MNLEQVRWLQENAVSLRCLIAVTYQGDHSQPVAVLNNVDEADGTVIKCDCIVVQSCSEVDSLGH